MNTLNDKETDAPKNIDNIIMELIVIIEEMIEKTQNPDRIKRILKIIKWLIKDVDNKESK